MQRFSRHLRSGNRMLDINAAMETQPRLHMCYVLCAPGSWYKECLYTFFLIILFIRHNAINIYSFEVDNIQKLIARLKICIMWIRYAGPKRNWKRICGKDAACNCKRVARQPYLRHMVHVAPLEKKKYINKYVSVVRRSRFVFN